MSRLIILTLLSFLIYTQNTLSSAPVKLQKKQNNVMISASELASLIQTAKDTGFYNIRTYLDYSIVHTPKSINMPMQYLQSRITEVKRYSNLIIIGNDDKEASMAMQMIKARYPEINIKVLAGGIGSWAEAGFILQNDLPHGC